MRKLIIFFLALCLGIGHIEAQVTTEGNDFWFGFLQNSDVTLPSSLEIFITSNVAASGTIEVFTNGAKIDFTITPGQTFKQVIAVEQFNSYAASGSGIVQKKAIHITSDADISVYAFNNRQKSADAAVILPSNSLGKKYYASTYFEEAPAGDGFGSEPSELLIVATQDDTRITINPAVITLDGKPAGVEFEITLNQGDIYQLQAAGDLTGTLIEAVSSADDCKNFAVFGGNRWGRVTGGQNCSAINNGTDYPGGYASDQLYEQMYPVATWGKQYAVIPYQGREGYVLQITASEDNTTVSVSGKGTSVLNEGEFLRIVRPDEASFISADKPIQVAQLSQSLSCDFPPGTTNPVGQGDPFMIMLSPNEQFLTRITFNALSASSIENYYVNVIVKTADIDQLTIDGSPITGVVYTPTPGNSDFSYATIPILKGRDYTLVSESGFIAYIYGFGQIESFGYVAGASLKNLNVQFTGADPYIEGDVISKQACLNAPIDFSARFEQIPGQPPVFTQFDWDFGDGSTGTGQDTVHIYTSPGEYEIILIASDGNNSCGGNSELITGTVTIVETEVSDDGIVGPVSVCPDVFGVEYSIEGPAENTYEWEVFGGSIVGSNTGEIISVDWGASRDDAFVRLVPFNYLGCPGDTLTLPVLINKELDPLTPRGDAEVCYIDRSSVTYSTPFTNGSKYFWEIEGGDILGGQGTNQVTVDWGDVGTGNIWYREFNPDINECEGVSPKLPVEVYTALESTASISHVLCNAGNTGEISLTLSGGKPGDYTVNWDNGMTGADISGLTAGKYIATIRDELGCEIQATCVVTEPEALTISSSMIKDVRCFEQSNGMISLEVKGGTPDGSGGYSYSWSGNGINQTTTEPLITGLAKGNYDVIVTDANGCTTGMDFFVDAPDPLEADLTTLINQPICPDATDGTAYLEAKGGVPDYQFYWSNDPGTDEQEGRNFSRGTYTVRIVDANGCEATEEIEVTERFPRIYLPNAFSPNGDESNDTFKAVTDCDLNFSMQVFNEWGAVIFATTDIFQGWDGTLEGQQVPNGKYSYIVFYSGSINGVSFEETLRGTLRLLR